MRAARLIEPGQPLRVDDVPVPELRPGEVLVEVRACGLCGTAFLMITILPSRLFVIVHVAFWPAVSVMVPSAAQGAPIAVV